MSASKIPSNAIAPTPSSHQADAATKIKLQPMGLAKGRKIVGSFIRNWVSKGKDSVFATLNKKIRDFKIEQIKNRESFLMPKKAQKAKDVIPEYLGKTTDINDARDFHNGKLIGEGFFGVVTQAITKSKNKTKNMSPLLVKKTHKSNVSHSNIAKAKQDAIIENKQNILMGVESTLDKAGNIITLYKGERLTNLVKADKVNTPNIEGGYKSKKMSNEMKIDLSKQLLSEISAFHQKGRIHQDIKLDNILVNAKGKLSVIDLGGIADVSFVQNIDNVLIPKGMSDVALTPPEVTARNNLISNRFDSWCAGLAIYELFTGEPLLKGASLAPIWNNEKDYFMQKNLASNITNNENIPAEVKGLINALLQRNPNKRIAVTNALNLDAFKQKKSDKPSLIALTTRHDRNFKKLARLENRLEKTSKKNPEIRKELKEQIRQTGALVKNLQKEINKFNIEEKPGIDISTINEDVPKSVS